ncbi:ABC transporter permease [Mycolicibacterium sp. 22603]|uniref:ABC transporter permease n=1 Tax=Mycolicibacterium sp. 22603 TaxID=3453950 RepID=UPI003F860971
MSAPVILTARLVRRNRVDLAFAVVAPLVGIIGLVVLLQDVIVTEGMTYAQYVLPAVVVQAMFFGALTTTDRAAADNVDGMSRRLQTLPISRYAPLTARMYYCLVRGLLAVVAATLGALLFGFRFTGGAGYAAAFFALALLLTLALSLGADAVGARAKRSEVAGQLLLIPQLLLVLLSTGLAPTESFPEALQPFVSRQPVSQITEALRDFTDGRVDTPNAVASLGWCLLFLCLFGYAAIREQRRSR